MPPPKEVEEILKRYKGKIKEYVEETGAIPSEFSGEYVRFREESLTRKRTLYENLCNSLEKTIRIKPSEKILPGLREAIECAHLSITPEGAATFATCIGIAAVVLGIFIGLLLFVLTGELSVGIPILLALGGVLAVRPLTNIPIFIATRWRLRASNQMVLCILYAVMFMRHTSNIEWAIKFATEHIGPPLSIDLRKVFWDVETGKYATMKESLSAYLEQWRKYNLEFVTSFHLIESSLYEPKEERRLELLDKALEVILNGTYEKMLHYAHDLKSPITMLHMLGVILPILGLVIFPLIGSFMGGIVKWYHLAFLYNLILPVIIFSVGMNLLAKRPTGYGEAKASEEVLQKKVSPMLIVLIAVLFITIGLFPLVLHALDPTADIFLGDSLGNFLDYQEGRYGPFGVGALLFSFFIPFGAALATSFYYKRKTKGLIDVRNETKRLEQEFSSALFQLGSRVGEGIPSELAFGKVAEVMEGTPTGNFFRMVDTNIKHLGMGLREAIFNRKTGAILNYPSSLVESSMEVLLEAAKKGPKIVAHSLMSISQYIDRIHSVNERLKDLLAEIVSSMKSQIAFLAPAIAGIVVGVSSMIVNVITQLGAYVREAGGTEALGEGAPRMGIITDMFKVSDIIPGFFFQVVVGVYIVQLIYILTIMSNGIENGTDKLNEQWLLGKNMLRSTLLYIGIAAVVVVLFNLLARQILASVQY